MLVWEPIAILTWTWLVIAMYGLEVNEIQQLQRLGISDVGTQVNDQFHPATKKKN